MNANLLIFRQPKSAKTQLRKREIVQEGKSPKPSRTTMQPAYMGTVSPQPVTPTSDPDKIRK